MPHPKSPAGLRVGIVNPLTLVGNEVKALLRSRDFPAAKIALLDSAGVDAGALTDIGDEAAVVAPIAQEGLDDLDLVFFCGPAAANADWIARSAEDDFIAIDLSRPSAEEGRHVVAGVNLDSLAPGDEVLVSPHPIAVPIALILHQIATVTPVELCAATVVQPASEFDQEGVEELAQQTVSVLNLQTVPQKVFERQLAFNLYPAPERPETTIVSQVKGITDARLQLSVLVMQGTIFHGHTFSLFIKTREAIEPQRIVDALKANPALAFAEGDQQFGTTDAAGEDEVLITEVREDPHIRGGYWVWAVCDNLRRGSALNAVLVAEHVLFGQGAAN
jgi:aspartate-semialdehyde dehydrogenase